ncbi:MAG: ribose 5-phosphate isomerase B [Alphaproteobacteria bacterium]|nr:ribose 5-phosphate isomerase B [Alphaproteobacteria bacterium]
MPGVQDVLTLVVGSDHAAVALRGAVVAHLRSRGHTVNEEGPAVGESADYPDVARPIAERVARGELDRAVLICGTGQGMAMTANKVANVRAALVMETFSARMATQHNDARILCLGARVVGEGLALDCVDAWLDASFEGGRHARRVERIG